MDDVMKYAKAFMNKGVDEKYTNTKDGNLVINKMLYFAQLISLAKYEEELYSNDIYAFENGSVVEDFRQQYKSDYNNLKVESSLFDLNKLSEHEKDVIEKTIELFSDFSAEELSEITHGHTTWINSFEGSKEGNFYHKDKQLMETESLINNEVPWIKNFLSNSDDEELPYVMNNNILFYYDPNSFIEEQIFEITHNFKGEDSVYTVVKEDDGEALIY
ncbi:Panacea domain-containing protein [Staphylococcus succinus]|uniref:Panacea domain-containing protein n=1 Tax=Staphylococcus succinus TaxID=61015 RepID=UPI000D1EBB56|nr:Panacea domain-containing protein [Staphylococcus succinus]PTI38868.1 hypothetical protein BU062_12510 [Staphylococcus succinus]PTI48460.1 hypothetical protein BU060_03250 [Staphylococcus succinus]